MLKKLRIKFICIFMVTVTVMLGVILGTVITLTHKNIEQQNISAMRDIAMPPKPHNKPEKEFEHIPKPHFSLLITPDGEFIAEDNGMFDLSDEEHGISLCIHQSGIIKINGVIIV